MTNFHELQSKKDSDTIERIQMEDETFVLMTAEIKYHEGDGVQITASDGGVFIGEITEIANYDAGGEYFCSEWDCSRNAPHIHISIS